MGVLVSAF